MSPGKLAARVSHAAMAFLTDEIKRKVYHSKDNCYKATLIFNKEMYEQWIEGSFIKIVCGAQNRDWLMWAIDKANELGMQKGEDYFLIRDNCMTELEPEDKDGRTLTCIGFKPMEDIIIDQIGKEYQLY